MLRLPKHLMVYLLFSEIVRFLGCARNARKAVKKEQAVSLTFCYDMIQKQLVIFSRLDLGFPRFLL